MTAQYAVMLTPASSPNDDLAADGCDSKRGTARALIAIARPWQWVKNGLVLAALVFNHRLFQPRDAFSTNSATLPARASTRGQGSILSSHHIQPRRARVETKLIR